MLISLSALSLGDKSALIDFAALWHTFASSSGSAVARMYSQWCHELQIWKEWPEK